MVKVYKNIICRLLVYIVISILFLSIINISIIANSNNNTDLRIASVDWQGVIKEGEETKFKITIINDGPENFSKEIKVSFYLDNQFLVSNFTSEDLDVGESVTIYISWTPGFGDNKQHQLRFLVNNDFNNLKDFWVIIREKDTSLEFTKIELPDRAYINETVLINASVVNKGSSTNQIILAKVNSSATGEIDTFEKTGLKRNEKFNFTFNWTPSKIGVQKLVLFVFLNNTLHDTYEKNVNVTITSYEWWNENWHYRYILSIKGEGNYSQNLNFTKILKDLDVSLRDFENDSIRIVKYSTSGEVIKVVKNYTFIESDGFDKTTNATGILKWRVSSNSDISHYAVYFDVEANIGTRDMLDEVFIGKASEKVSLYSNERYEGWWAELDYPNEKESILVDDPQNISISSKAKIIDISGFVFYNENHSLNYSLDFLDTGNNINWYNNSLNLREEGNWTIQLSCLDNAGFYYNFSSVFYVGQTDLKLEDIEVTIADDVSYTDFHRNDSLNITAHVKTSFASVKKVNVSLRIFDLENKKNITKGNITSNFTKNTITELVFSWKANVTGDFNIILFVDMDEKISEKDETNNKMEKEITISEWPDLWVKDIILSKKEVTQFDMVKITAEIKNNGQWDADKYKIGLFMEEKIREEPSMSYENMVYSTYISIDKNSTKQKELFWDSAQPGDWTVGVKIFWNESKYDLYPLNNMLSSTDFLRVNVIESGKPIIRNIEISPSAPIQGDLVSITAEVYDSSGLDIVDINITTPGKTIITGPMFRTRGDRFKYLVGEVEETGEYNMLITAVDKTPKKNTQTFESVFNVGKDNIEPEIKYLGADPIAQLEGLEVTISSVISDNIGISDVEITIFTPDNLSYVKNMDLKGEKYVYEDVYKTLGRYSFFITATDVSKNVGKSAKEYFWITDDLDDFDNDGIPNEWENKYKLNSYNASDADFDFDNDGYTNVEEYHMNTNPRENILVQNMASNIRQNIWYLVFSIITFLVLIFLSIYSRRRVF